MVKTIFKQNEAHVVVTVCVYASTDPLLCLVSWYLLALQTTLLVVEINPLGQRITKQLVSW